MVYQLTGLEGKVAVVTGAGRMRSIGRSIAIELAKAGCNVAPVGTNRDPATFPDEEKVAGWRDVESVAEEARDLGRLALALRADISRESDVVELLDAVVSEFGRVDIVVNNASVPIGRDRVPLTEMDADVFRRLIDVNLTGSFLMSKHFGARLVSQGDGGSIVNISSIAGKVMARNGSAYGSSKAALQSITGSMAREVAAAGVRVNAVLPGIVDTSRMDASKSKPREWRQRTESIPLGRAGTPEEVAAMVVFLCSDQGAWITGQQYIVDGGMTIGY
jgi:NAD(P)-dependent dehydrogenase (short-subunit alcohol dehydrogenase family)